MNPPKTARIAMSGIMAFTPSAAPRFFSVVESVSQALKAASFAVEPKKVITQSRMMVKEMPTEAALTAAPKRRPITSVRMKAKARMEIPQAI